MSCVEALRGQLNGPLHCAGKLDSHKIIGGIEVILSGFVHYSKQA
jgi:hypothetical protein